MGRFFSVPPDLWTGTVLHFPADFVRVYREVLIGRNLLTQAKTEYPKDDLIGGPLKVESENHFCHRFPVCAGRTQYVCLDPGQELDEAHSALISGLSDGRITVLDAPCGAGGASVTLLTTLIYLRRNFILPCLPLDLDIVGADISPTSLEMYQDLLQKLAPVALAAGIRVRIKTREWDAMRADQTSNLVDEWFMFSPSAEEHFIMVSNFSGALKAGGSRNAFERSLNHILERANNKRCNLIWIEPAMDRVIESIFPWLYKILAKATWFSGAVSGDGTANAHYNIFEPIVEKEHESSVAIQRFETVGFGS